MSTIGTRLRQLRQKAELNQDAFGELCGVSKGAVSQWESDQTTPDTANLLALRQKLTFSLDWLLTGAGHADEGIKESTRKLLEVAEALPDYAVVRLTETGHSYAQLIEQAQSPKAGNGH